MNVFSQNIWLYCVNILDKGMSHVSGGTKQAAWGSSFYQRTI